MEKKFIKLTILISTILFIFSQNIFAQKDAIKNTFTDNAAIFYKKAVDLLKYPLPREKEITKKIGETIKNGWKGENKELMELLAQNKSSLKEFKKGLLIQKCDFNFGKKYKFYMNEPPRSYSQIRNLSNLVLLLGRYYEKQGKFNKAITEYLSVLKLAQHLAQDNHQFLSKMSSLDSEDKAFNMLENYLTSNQADPQECQRILNYLVKLEKRQFPAKELVEIEKEYFISTINMIIEDDKKKAQKEGFKIKLGEKSYREVYWDEIKRYGYEMADKHYGNYLKAMETNRASDWEFAQREYKKEAGDWEKMKSYEEIMATPDIDEEKYPEKAAREYVKDLLVITDYKKVAEEYYSARAKLKRLKSLAAQKAGKEKIDL